jgi:hypothetical protein
MRGARQKPGCEGTRESGTHPHSTRFLTLIFYSPAAKSAALRGRTRHPADRTRWLAAKPVAFWITRIRSRGTGWRVIRLICIPCPTDSFATPDPLPLLRWRNCFQTKIGSRAAAHRGLAPAVALAEAGASPLSESPSPAHTVSSVSDPLFSLEVCHSGGSRNPVKKRPGCQEPFPGPYGS